MAGVRLLHSFLALDLIGVCSAVDDGYGGVKVLVGDVLRHVAAEAQRYSNMEQTRAGARKQSEAERGQHRTSGGRGLSAATKAAMTRGALDRQHRGAGQGPAQ